MIHGSTSSKVSSTPRKCQRSEDTIAIPSLIQYPAAKSWKKKLIRFRYFPNLGWPSMRVRACSCFAQIKGAKVLIQHLYQVVSSSSRAANTHALADVDLSHHRSSAHVQPVRILGYTYSCWVFVVATLNVQLLCDLLKLFRNPWHETQEWMKIDEQSNHKSFWKYLQDLGWCMLNPITHTMMWNTLVWLGANSARGMEPSGSRNINELWLGFPNTSHYLYKISNCSLSFIVKNPLL